MSIPSRDNSTESTGFRWEEIARGRTSDIYAWGDNAVLKLYRPEFPKAMAEREAEITRTAWELGLPVPAVHRLIEIEGRIGIIFDRVEGETALRAMTRRPFRLLQFARILAEKHAEIHSRSPAKLRPLKDRLAEKISRVEHLSHDERNLVLSYMNDLPDEGNLCHGDFHPDNLLMSRDRIVVIDWIDAASGHPAADVARTLLLLRTGDLPENTPGKWALDRIRNLFLSVYLRKYVAISKIGKSTIQSWLLPVMTARLAENVPGDPEKLLPDIRRRINAGR